MKAVIFLGLIILVSFLLVVVIMVQNPKGGGLSSSFGGGGAIDHFVFYLVLFIDSTVTLGVPTVLPV